MTEQQKKQLEFGKQYWKLAIHLICKTKHFGVNNEWWSKHPSPVGWSCRKRLWGMLTVMPIVRNYQSLKVRSCLGWIPGNDADALGYSQEILGRKYL